MSKFLKLLIGLAAVGCSNQAFAAPAAGITYDCDTAAGHFSELAIPAPAGAFTVTGHVKVNQIAKIDKWSPITRLQIAEASPAPGQPSLQLAGFSLNALPARLVDPKVSDNKLVIQYLQLDETANGVQKQHEPFGLGPVGSTSDFSLLFDGSAVTVRVGGQEQRLALLAPNPVVRIVCSTGEFLFTDLKIEKAG